MFKFLEQILYDNTIEEEYHRKLRQKSSSNSAIIVGLVAAMGGFLYGYDTGLINGLLEMKYVYTNFASNGETFTSHERALTVAMLSLGTFVGALIAPLISDNYGRKFSIILSSTIVFNVGNILQIASTELALLAAGRFVAGVSVGILSAIVPLYQAEASPKWVRGSIVFTYQWAITWGLLIASAVTQATRKMNNSGSYRIPIGLQFLFALILCTGMLFLPESPRYYVQKNNIQKALESLAKLRRLNQDDADLIEELVEIKANYDYELSFGKTTILDCFRSGGGRHKQRLRMATGIGVQFFQQCTGINFIFYYGVNFFLNTGVQNYYIMSFITYLVNMVFTIPGIILIDTIGRRKLLLWGGVGMSVSNFIIAICGVSIKQPEINSILSVSFSCVFISFFASSWGGCTWALCSDIYSISIRQKAVAITAATNWLVNFIFAYITPYLIDTGLHTAAIGNKIFFMWGGFNALAVVFVYFAVYETKGLKLEEVDYMYAHCDSAIISPEFRSTKIDYAKLDENYNPISEESTSTPSDVSHHIIVEKDTVPEPLYNSNQGNDLTIIPYNNILSPTSTTEQDTEEFRRESVTSHQFSNTNMSTISPLTQGDSHVSNDYQSYLESLKREYSGIQQLIPQEFSDEESIEISNIETSQNLPTTVIATPYFTQPPSDSDSSDEEEEEEEQKEEQEQEQEKKQK